MSTEKFEVYRHSGKFGIHGPVMALGAALVLAYPLGFAYSYLLKWIPFVYVNFLLTAGYGFGFGLLGGMLLRFGKVRNTLVAALSGLGIGLVALYFEWNGHVHALFKDAPALCLPQEILGAMQALYEHGSWGLRSGGPVTGVPLAIIWGLEAAVIVGLAAFVAYVTIAKTPFCEKNQCWLDEEKKIDTVEAFTDPIQVNALKIGDLGPLTHAMPRTLGADAFTRLTLKQSPHCDEFCTLQIQTVTLVSDNKGNLTEKVQDLTGDLVLPKRMSELITKFESFGSAKVAA